MAKEAQKSSNKKIPKKISKKMATWRPGGDLMIDRLVEMCYFLVDMADVGNRNLHPTKTEWDQAFNLRDLLKKAFIMTMSLQF